MSNFTCKSKIILKEIGLKRINYRIYLLDQELYDGLRRVIIAELTGFSKFTVSTVISVSILELLLE